MGQVLHGSATTTHAVRAAIQRSKASVQELSEHYGINPKTVRKWRKRSSVEDAPMGPKERRSTVLSPEEEALGADEESTHLERMLNAVEALERAGHIIGPQSLLAANKP